YGESTFLQECSHATLSRTPDVRARPRRIAELMAIRNDVVHNTALSRHSDGLHTPDRLVSPGPDRDDSCRGPEHDVAARVASSRRTVLADDPAARTGGGVAAAPASRRDFGVGT